MGNIKIVHPFYHPHSTSFEIYAKMEKEKFFVTHPLSREEKVIEKEKKLNNMHITCIIIMGQLCLGKGN